MADSQSGYQVGPGRPPLHTRFQKGQSGNPGGRSKRRAEKRERLGKKIFPARFTERS